jgi:hypothetical protein
MGLSTGTYCVPLSGSSKNGDPSRRSAVVIFGKRMRKPADQLVATAAFALLIFVSRICRSLGGYFSIAAGQARTAPHSVGHLPRFPRIEIRRDPAVTYLPVQGWHGVANDIAAVYPRTLPAFAATRRQFPSDRGLASELQNHRPDLRHDSGVSRSESYGCERRAAR